MLLLVLLVLLQKREHARSASEGKVDAMSWRQPTTDMDSPAGPLDFFALGSPAGPFALDFLATGFFA